jgi:hypothetical protein
MPGRVRTRHWRERKWSKIVSKETDAISIQQLFLKVAPRLKAPPLEFCENVGELFRGIGVFEERKSHRIFDYAVKDLRSFVNNIPGMRVFLSYLKSTADFYRTMDFPLDPSYIDALEKTALAGVEFVDAIEKAACPFFAWHEKAKLTSTSWGDIALCIAGLARAAWIIGNGWEGRPPQSFHNSRDPICIFVSEALILLGVHKTPSAVSAVLRRLWRPYTHKI